MSDTLKNPQCVTDNKCELASAVNLLTFALDGVVPSRQQHQRRCIAAQLKIVDYMKQEEIDIDALTTLVKADVISVQCPVSLWSEIEEFDKFVGDDPVARAAFQDRQPRRRPSLD